MFNSRANMVIEFWKWAFSLLFLVSTVIVSAAEIEAGLLKSLEVYEADVTLSDEGTLRIVMVNHSEVNKELYELVIKIGVCETELFGGFELKGIKKVQVLEDNLENGFVFHGGKASCVLVKKQGNLDELTTPYKKESTEAEKPQEQSKYDCGKKYCKDMVDCAEAKYKLEKCGHSHLDRNKDGIPCENICN